ncbi:MAG: 2-C-methyl-D-erythritol 2,4-cyclodiphosphate synthase [Thermodesulfobacteriota bacterium]
MRIGSGYDVHKFAEKRRLVLGGVDIPFKYGLLGHSDADVLLHAICDALLGAIGAGDIGRHFPDTDPRYSGVSSLKLLGQVHRLLMEKGFHLVNIDSTIVAQQPRLAEYLPEMSANIATTLSCADSQVNVKATTTEGLGFSGRGEGIAAYAVVLVEESGR